MRKKNNFLNFSNVKTQFKNNFSQQINNSSVAILSLINKFFWKSKLAPISMFVFPLSFILIYFVISNYSKNNIGVTSGFNLYIAFSTMPISLICLPQLLFELKRSIILRRIAISNISSFRYNILISIYFFLMCIFSTLFIFVAVSIFENVNMGTFLSSFNIGDYIYSLLIFFIVSISFGIVLSSITKSGMWLQMIGLGIILISLMLSGQFIPISIIGTILPVKIIGLFNPLNYPLNLMNNVILSKDFHNFTQYWDQIVLIIGDKNIENILGAEVYKNLSNLANNFSFQNIGIFDLSHSFVIPKISILNNFFVLSNAFPGGKVDPEIIKKLTWPSDGNYYSVIYDVWEKVLNIFMPYFLIAFFTVLGNKIFKWSSR